MFLYYILRIKKWCKYIVENDLFFMHRLRIIFVISLVVPYKILTHIFMPSYSLWFYIYKEKEKRYVYTMNAVLSTPEAERAV